MSLWVDKKRQNRHQVKNRSKTTVKIGRIRNLFSASAGASRRAVCRVTKVTAESSVDDKHVILEELVSWAGCCGEEGFRCWPARRIRTRVGDILRDEITREEPFTHRRCGYVSVCAPAWSTKTMGGRTNFDTCAVPESCIYTALLTIQPNAKATAVCILDRTARVEVDMSIAIGGLDHANKGLCGNRKSDIGISTRSIEGAARISMECHRIKDFIMDPLHDVNFASCRPIGSGQPC